MTSNEWVSRGTLLPDDSRIDELLVMSEKWQMFSTNPAGKVLVVIPDLCQQWLELKLLPENLFSDENYNGRRVCIYCAKHGEIISSVQSGPYPKTSIEAEAFAVALRETRCLIETLSLHDALYIESISRLLPCNNDVTAFDDKTVLGMWLSAGVMISIDSLRRLSDLTKWMDTNKLKKIISSAGFEVSHFDALHKTKYAKNEETKGKAELPIIRTTVSKDEQFSLPGRPYLEEFFNEHVVDIVRNETKYERMGIGFPSAIVLHGKPGCGKTYAVDRLVEYLGWPCFSINSGSIGSPYIHETSKKIAEIFDKAIENAPSVIVIDEMEAFLTERGTGQFSGIHHVEEVAEFLRRIPEATKQRVLIVAMTNMIETIDTAILRRGRFDHIIEVKMPTKEEVMALLNKTLEHLPIDIDVKYEAISDLLKNRPLSDVAFVVKEAGRIAASKDKDTIDSASFFEAISLMTDKPKNKVKKIGFSEE